MEWTIAMTACYWFQLRLQLLVLYNTWFYDFHGQSVFSRSAIHASQENMALSHVAQSQSIQRPVGETTTPLKNVFRISSRAAKKSFQDT